MAQLLLNGESATLFRPLIRQLCCRYRAALYQRGLTTLLFNFIRLPKNRFIFETVFESYHRTISVGVINLSKLSLFLLLFLTPTPSNATTDKTDRATPTGAVHVTSVQKANVIASGELKKWHPVTITLEGPTASETGSPNPFRDYRFEVVFSQAEKSFTVPGYFAADGNAAESSATSGNIWRAHFIPPTTGDWTFRTSFRSGTDVAVSTDPNAGTPIAEYDDIFDSITIAETDKAGADFRGKGKLRYVGEHYLQFDNGDFYIKGGADSPENLLAYLDFDGTSNNGGTNFTKTYSNHIQHWNTGDPTWKGDKGKGLIGAINYLGSKGMNSAYFLTMNVNGDGNDVWPWTSAGERYRYDVSKLDQWNIVFDQMDKKGILLHVQTQETENELLLDGGNLGVQRKLYYRELIARFGYHHAITWNLGEENEDNTTQQRKDFADYIRDLDPYDHPIIVHTLPGQWDQIYDPLIDYPSFEGPSLQVGQPEQTHDLTLDWVNKSAASNKKWYVCMDESGPWQLGATPDGPGNNHDTIRKEVLWGNLMAGGGGVEWYFGYDYPDDHDLSSEDWTTRDNVWNITRYALDFFQNYLPFVEMKSNNSLATNANSYVYAKEGEVYAVYLKNGGSTSLNLSGASGTLSVKWYDPRNGGGLQNGTVTEVNGGSTVSIGSPPNNTGTDWVALVTTQQVETFGDATNDGSVTALDASLILQHSIDLIILPGTITPVIDVSDNGEITAFDASLVLQHVVQLIDCFPIDPDCSSGKASARIVPEATLEAVPNDDALAVLLNIPRTEGTNQSLSAIVRYDASLLALDDVATNLPDGWNILDNREEGLLRLAIAGLPAALEGDLVTLQFNRLGDTAGPISASVKIDEAETQMLALGDLDEQPSQFVLESNYPNPFNPATTIRYALPEAAHVHIEVFDLTGRSVSMLVDQPQAAGSYSVQFDGTGLPSGTYLYRMSAGAFVSTQKMTLIK